VTQDRTNTAYLLFEDLEKIIIRNWEEAFKPVFHDQHAISLRFGELVEIRNSIAHTRMLSQEGMIRLNQYSQDLINMVEPASS
jgi:Swt1-like HEPN